jgi:hypothetical protein
MATLALFPSFEDDALMTHIPHLEEDGSNWAVFSTRFREAMQAAGRWGHYDGTTPRPSPATVRTRRATAEEARLTDAWDYEDTVARYILSSHLPDSTALEVSDLRTAEERWTRVTQEYQATSAYAHHDLETKFLEMRCPKGGDVRTFLTDLRFKRQELAAAGVKLDNRDYQRTVLRGIPGELATFASALLSAHAIATASQPTRLDTNTLISHICEEADRLKNRRRAPETATARRTRWTRPWPSPVATRAPRRHGRASVAAAASPGTGSASAAHPTSRAAPPAPATAAAAAALRPPPPPLPLPSPPHLTHPAVSRRGA